MHESTRFSPFYLMFGRHPRLVIDAFLGIGLSEERKSHQDYVHRIVFSTLMKKQTQRSERKEGNIRSTTTRRPEHHY